MLDTHVGIGSHSCWELERKNTILYSCLLDMESQHEPSPAHYKSLQSLQEVILKFPFCSTAGRMGSCPNILSVVPDVCETLLLNRFLLDIPTSSLQL